jgi:hypothetical protein
MVKPRCSFNLVGQEGRYEARGLPLRALSSEGEGKGYSAGERPTAGEHAGQLEAWHG